MEIWIRSQDEISLVKCTSISIRVRQSQKGEEIAVFNQDDLLGEYNNMDEAFDVVDQIQGHIDRGCISEDNFRVFDMPEKRDL